MSAGKEEVLALGGYISEEESDNYVKIDSLCYCKVISKEGLQVIHIQGRWRVASILLNMFYSNLERTYALHLELSLMSRRFAFSALFLYQSSSPLLRDTLVTKWKGNVTTMCSGSQHIDCLLLHFAWLR